MARVDYRSASYEIWQAMAAGWDRERRWMWDVSRAVSEQMLEASRSIGPDGRLIWTDFAPEMVGCAGALKISMGYWRYVTGAGRRDRDGPASNASDRARDGAQAG